VRFDAGSFVTTGLFVRNLTTGQSQAVTGAEDLVSVPTWSPDGDMIAFWSAVCLVSSSGGRWCEVVRESLNVLELATGRLQVVDSSTQSGGNNVAFSSDGSKIAYGFGSNLYTSELR
jgi:Tol biopolymer transport system component